MLHDSFTALSVAVLNDDIEKIKGSIHRLLHGLWKGRDLVIEDRSR